MSVVYATLVKSGIYCAECEPGLTSPPIPASLADNTSYLVSQDPPQHSSSPFLHSLLSDLSEMVNLIMSLSCISLHPLRSIYQDKSRYARD